MVKIVTDSVSGITPEMASELGVTVVPLWVNFGEESYRDRIDIQPDEFFYKLENSKIFPTTGAPPAGAYAKAYDKLAEETDEVMTLVISSKLSATYEAAVEGVELRKKKDCRVEVIDTLTAISGEALLVILAVEEAKQGANLDKLIGTIRKYIPKTHVRICFDTLEYLHRGGRINTAQAFLGSVLKMNPVIGIVDGLVEGMARTRSRSKALDWLSNFVKGFSNIKSLAIDHGTTPDETENLIQRLESVFPASAVRRFTMGPVVGAHTGPRAIAVSLVEQV